MSEYQIKVKYRKESEVGEAYWDWSVTGPLIAHGSIWAVLPFSRWLAWQRAKTHIRKHQRNIEKTVQI